MVSSGEKSTAECEARPAAPCRVGVPARHAREEVAAHDHGSPVPGRRSMPQAGRSRELLRSSLGNRPGSWCFYGAAHCLSVGLARIDQIGPVEAEDHLAVAYGADYVRINVGDSVVRHLEREHPPGGVAVILAKFILVVGYLTVIHRFRLHDCSTFVAAGNWNWRGTDRGVARVPTFLGSGGASVSPEVCECHTAF